MDYHNQVMKVCGICGNEQVYNGHHRLNNPCKLSVAKSSARY